MAGSESFHRSVNDFISTLSSTGGLAHGNRYWVEFHLPQGINADTGSYQVNKNSVNGSIQAQDNAYNANGEIGVMCQSMQFPGRSLMTIESRHYPTLFKLPYSSQYDDITLNFTTTHNLNERKYFEIWQETVINITTGTLNFYDEYVTNIKMHQLDTKGCPLYSIELVNAYPIAINGLDYSYAEQDSLLQTTVILTYEYWRNLEFDTQGRYSQAPF